MFFIVPEKDEHFLDAMEILAMYHVAAEVYGGNGSPIYLAIGPDHFESEDDDERLAEMAFQMNWHQGKECPDCGEICGHMVFTKPIQAAF